MRPPIFVHAPTPGEKFVPGNPPVCSLFHGCPAGDELGNRLRMRSHHTPACHLHQRQPHRCPTGDEPGDVARSVLHSPNIVCNPLQGTRRWFKNLWFKKPLAGRFPSRQCESQSLHLSASSQRTQTTIGIRRDTTQNNRIQGRSSPQENMVTLSVVLAPPGTDEWLRLTLNWCGETSPC